MVGQSRLVALSGKILIDCGANGGSLVGLRLHGDV